MPPAVSPARFPARPPIAAALALAAFLGGAALARGPAQAPGAPGARVGEAEWRRLEPGLDLGTFEIPRRSDAGDSRVCVLRVDPARFELRLLNASAPGQGERLTAREWCLREGLVAAINASMYQKDRRTSVSLMRTRSHVNNPRLSKDRSVLAFDPLEPGLPPARLLDRECDDFEALLPRYGALVQSIRMLSCRGVNVWQPQARRWSAAAIGSDRDGRVLLIHVRTPISVHDLIEVLRALPIGLERALYAEGGPEAQLYVRSGTDELEFLGSRTAGEPEGADGSAARPLPNVVGVARRPAPHPAGSVPATSAPRPRAR